MPAPRRHVPAPVRTRKTDQRLTPVTRPRPALAPEQVVQDRDDPWARHALEDARGLQLLEVRRPLRPPSAGLTAADPMTARQVRPKSVGHGLGLRARNDAG